MLYTGEGESQEGEYGGVGKAGAEAPQAVRRWGRQQRRRLYARRRWPKQATVQWVAQDRGVRA